MRKLFILLSVLALSITAHAADIIYINTETEDALRLALNDANDGDEIVMAAGTYIESPTNYIAFASKGVVVRAADGANVILKPHVPITLSGGARAEFRGIKIDVSELCSVNDYSHLMYPSDNAANNRLVLDGCEIYGFDLNSSLINCGSDKKLDVVSIANCYFHNIKKSCLFIESTGAINISISNSTFADISTNTESYWAGVIDTRATSGSFSVDHCTFYNVQAMNTDYAAIGKVSIPGAVVSNCIFAMPTSTDNLRAIRDVATANNCLTYNYKYDSNWGIHSSVTKNNCIQLKNPYFVNTNAGNYDFTVASFSPAREAGTESSDLGDPRWDSDDSDHPTTINISAGTDVINAAVEAAWPGDEIVMATGTYNETALLALNKDITIKAADGAIPIVVPANGFAISNGAEVTLQGVKIDATSITGRLIEANDATAGNELTLEGCEFYNYTPNNSMIHVASSKKLDACTMNNCYFHNINKSCFFNENTGVSNLAVTNCTFANITTNASSPYTGVIDTRAESGSFSVDHCTFYNVMAMSTDYAAIGKVSTPGAVVSNCIFAMPTSTDNLRAIRDVATANNCLTYNYTKDSNWGIHGDVSKNNCTQLKDPLFNDLANNNYTYDANWSTGSISPAFGTATDGTNLGDPRWDSDNEVIPSSSIASSYDLLPTKAQLTGDVELNASNHIKYKGTATPGTAKWKLHVDRACMINAVVDQEAGNESGCQYTLTVKDADGNTVAAPAQPSATYNADDINLPGTITISAAGDYTFILTNSKSSSASALDKIILSYFGGAVQTIATDANTTLNVADAWYNTGGSRAEGQITYSGWNSADSWVKWNIATTETKFYDLTLNFSSDNAHSMAVNIYENEEASPVATVSESWTDTHGTLTLTDRVNLVGGKNYIVKVTNPTSGSHAKVTSVVFAPVVATATELPNTLAFSNAVLSEKARIIDGMIYFNEIGDTDPRGQWAEWKVTTDHNGLFLFTMCATSDNDQTYKITILNSGAEELDFFEKGFGNGAQTIKHYFALAQGTYFVKVENTKSYSHGHLTSLVVTEPNDVVTLDEAATDNTSWADKVVAKEAEGPLYDVRIIRTIKAGMYNTICLPFEVSTSQCREIFGADVQLRTLGTATLEEGDFVLNLNFDVASDIYPGTPLLIKTSRDIVNPVFAGVKFTTETPGSTTRTNANFVGNFVAGTIPASENNLFLGANNTMYFPTVDMPILGMRAFFRVHGALAGMIKRARIIEREEVATDIELVNQPKVESRKLLINGQLVIIRDGARYNVMGTRIQ